MKPIEVKKIFWLVIPLALFPHLYFLAAERRYDYLFYENGVVEWLQVGVLLLALFYAIRTLAFISKKPRWFLIIWLTLLVLGCIYIAGEEISWGQKFFGWQTPDWLVEINGQDETNLHNINSWLDRKPKYLLELGIILGCIIRPLWLKVRSKGVSIIGESLIWPTMVCLPSALLMESKKIMTPLQDFLGYRFFSVAEIQEVFIYYVIFIYAMSLYDRLRIQKTKFYPLKIT